MRFWSFVVKFRGPGDFEVIQASRWATARQADLAAERSVRPGEKCAVLQGDFASVEEATAYLREMSADFDGRGVLDVSEVDGNVMKLRTCSTKEEEARLVDEFMSRPGEWGFVDGRQ